MGKPVTICANDSWNRSPQELQTQTKQDEHICDHSLSGGLGYVNSYLQIAKQVLRQARRPLAPQAILDLAYLLDIVPAHLHGKTQHKTLQARLSEDIVKNRKHSAFFRTEPGVFFLSELLTDETLPKSFRTPIVARRRVRELTGDLALCVSKRKLQRLMPVSGIAQKRAILSTFSGRDFHYRNPKSEAAKHAFVWSTAVVRRRHQILTYRVGRYRDQRDSFLLKRSVGFSALVEAKDRSLFSTDEFGIAESATNAAKIDLDIDGPNSENPRHVDEVSLQYFLVRHQEEEMSELVGVVYFECPDWFEPTKRRLAMYDVQWLDLRNPINDLSDFDPWSQAILKYEFDFTPLGSM